MLLLFPPVQLSPTGSATLKTASLSYSPFSEEFKNVRALCCPPLSRDGLCFFLQTLADWGQRLRRDVKGWDDLMSFKGGPGSLREPAPTSHKSCPAYAVLLLTSICT